MKILVISPYVPHPNSGHGGGVLIFDFLENLAQRHEVTLISFVDESEKKLAEDLTRMKFRVKVISREKNLSNNIFRLIRLVTARIFQFLHSIIFWQPYQVSKFKHAGMAHIIQQETLAGHYDIVQIEYAQMGQYGRYVMSGKKVLREHDVMFRPAYRRFKKAKSFLKLFSFVEWCGWARYEPRLMKSFDHILTLTETDKRFCRKLYEVHQVSCSPLGVTEQLRIVPCEGREPNTLLFVGSFDHAPNIDAAEWLCREIFPLLYDQCPQVKLIIIGKNPPEKLRTLASYFPAISVLGFVDRIDTYFNSSSVFIAPLRFGGGIKMKILTAQSYGIPVVSTPIGIEGIEGTDENTWLIGRTASELVDKILLVFSDRAKAAAMAEASRLNIARHYSWSVANDKMDNLYHALIDPGPVGRAQKIDS